MQEAAPAATLDLSQYALPDGTLPVLCLSSPDGDGTPASTRHGHGCDACRLAGTPSLLAPSTDVFQPAAYRRETAPRPAETFPPPPPPLYRISSRGPPPGPFSTFAAGTRPRLV